MFTYNSDIDVGNREIRLLMLLRSQHENLSASPFWHSQFSYFVQYSGKQLHLLIQSKKIVEMQQTCFQSITKYPIFFND